MTGLNITLHSSPARLDGIHPVQIYLIGIRDSPDHRSVRNPGGGGGPKETDLGVDQAFLDP